MHSTNTMCSFKLFNETTSHKKGEKKKFRKDFRRHLLKVFHWMAISRHLCVFTVVKNQTHTITCSYSSDMIPAVNLSTSVVCGLPLHMWRPTST